MPSSQANNGRLSRVRNYIGLMLYLAGGWRSYQEIGEEFGWTINYKYKKDAHRCKTAYRNVKALEQAGLPVVRTEDTIPYRVCLPLDWVARTPWLRRYIIRNEPLKVANQKAEQARSLHK